MAVARFLFLLVLLVGGLALAGVGWNTYQQQESDVRHAVAVEGTVQSTDVEEFGWQFWGGEEAQFAQANEETRYRVVVRYTYTYEGTEYTSESVYPGPEKRHSLEANAQAVADEYSAGQTTTVYVNRNDPSRAFLIEEKTSFRQFLFMGLGGLLAMAGGTGAVKETLGAVGSDG